MKIVQDSSTRIIFGNGSFDRTLLQEALKKNKDKFCEIELSIPESGLKGKNLIVNKGIHGVIRFIKNDISKFTSLYIVFIDKEHCSGDCINCIVEISKKYGIKINESYELSDNVFRFRVSVGSKDFTAYFIFQGKYCCIEDFILMSCGMSVDERRGEGCCEYYKRYYNKLDPE
ncbi:MAG: hypothetical protein QXO96_06210, partial [Sulfolobales archaeon]